MQQFAHHIVWIDRGRASDGRTDKSTFGGNYMAIKGLCDRSLLLGPAGLGQPLAPQVLQPCADSYNPGDSAAMFADGGFPLKMPMARFEEDGRLSVLRAWASADEAVIFCRDPAGLHLPYSENLFRHPLSGRVDASSRAWR